MLFKRNIQRTFAQNFLRIKNMIAKMKIRLETSCKRNLGAVSKQVEQDEQMQKIGKRDTVSPGSQDQSRDCHPLLSNPPLPMIKTSERRNREIWIGKSLKKLGYPESLSWILAEGPAH